jgi:lipoprotein-releasing system ATP-binding protein
MKNDNNFILTARDVHKSFPMPEGKLDVLQGVDLDISRGEILSIMGASGAGKSTLLHILGALDRPNSGKVLLDNTDIFSMNEKQLAKLRNKSVGFVFQFHHLLPEFTAIENVMMPGWINKQDKQELYDRSKALLERVGLGNRIDHRPGELSGGEQQRVAIARALINDPKLVLADEPSGNLDRKTSESLHDLIWELNRVDNRTFVIATHNLSLAKKTDRIMFLQDGKLREQT